MYVMKLKFVWDTKKNEENVKKHGIHFEEATTIFYGFPLEIFHDPDHSVDDDRYIAAGFSDKGRILLVVHCESHSGTEIRIISARRATKTEQNDIFRGDRK